MEYSDLEFFIRRLTNGEYAIDMRFRTASIASDAVLASSVPLKLDNVVLMGNYLDVEGYGRVLTEMFFAPTPIRIGFIEAWAYATGAANSIRIRIRLDPTADELHSIRWETLCHPQTNKPLALSERVVLSRYSESHDLRPVILPPRPNLRALVVVANPSDLMQYALPHIDVEGEVSRVTRALNKIPTTIIGLSRHAGTVRAATLSAIIDALRDGPHIFYLVCHITQLRSSQYLWLEGEDGRAHRVAIDDFAQLIRQLSNPPLLTVLVACESAGTGRSEQALFALGPQLALAGVPAVLAVQGNMSISTIEQFMPTFFKELALDGQVDRALAAARSSIRTGYDWWQPVLFLRLRDGRLWTETSSSRSFATEGLVPLYQLRAPTADFVGREQEIERLVQKVRLNSRTGKAPEIAAIRGMGGIGKTEFALAVAQELKSSFPDGQIFLELRGNLTPSLSPEVALQNVIKAFQPNSQLPTELPSLQSLYRSILNGKRVLIIADDAREANQVQALVPPPSCCLLITSRSRFTLPGATLIDLGVLSEAEAAQLLLSINPRLENYTEQLAHLCGHLPLALRISASLLKNDPTINTANYLKRLDNERSRLEQLQDPDVPELSVESSFMLSFNLLDPYLQELLGTLSIFTANFDLEAAIAVSGSAPREQIESGLSQLYRRSLIEYDTSTSRYGLQELARVFFAARLDSKTREVLSLRHATYYARLISLASRSYETGGQTALTGLALFDQVQPHIDSAWNWLLGQENSNLSSHENLIQLEIDELILGYAVATYPLHNRWSGG